MIYPIKHILFACGVISTGVLMFFIMMEESWLKKFPFEWKNSILTKALLTSFLMASIVTGCTIQANVSHAWRDFDPVVVFHGEWDAIADHAQKHQYIGSDTVYYTFYPYSMEKSAREKEDEERINNEQNENEKENQELLLIKNSDRLICHAHSINGFSYIYEIEKTEDGKILSKPVDVGIVF